LPSGCTKVTLRDGRAIVGEPVTPGASAAFGGRREEAGLRERSELFSFFLFGIGHSPSEQRVYEADGLDQERCTPVRQAGIARLSMSSTWSWISRLKATFMLSTVTRVNEVLGLRASFFAAFGLIRSSDADVDLGSEMTHERLAGLQTVRFQGQCRRSCGGRG